MWYLTESAVKKSMKNGQFNVIPDRKCCQEVHEERSVQIFTELIQNKPET